MRTFFVALAVVAVAAGPARAQEHSSPYAHQGSDRLETLTQEELDGLLGGHRH